MAKTKVHGEFLKDSVVRFTAKAGENITKGQAVYISGVFGEIAVVSLADANDATKIPAFGLAEATVTTNSEVDVISFGTLTGLDTSGYSLGDILFVGTTAGALTNDPAGGETIKLQNIGKVQRVHVSNGSIKVGGAGRTNAVPNLDDGNIFIGDSNNKAISDSFTNVLNSEAGINSSADATAITIDSSENVGIGATTINEKLEVKGAVGFQASNSTNRWSAYTYTDNTFRLNYNGAGADEVVIDSSGNVGIGTTSPAYKLDVNGSAKTTGDFNVYGGNSGSNANRIALCMETGGAGRILVNGSGVGTNGSFKVDLSDSSGTIAHTLTYDSNGNLLVGKTNNALANNGVVVRGGGEILATNTSDLSANFNRLSTDGAIVGFYKDGTTVGSIGVNSGDIYIASTGTYSAGLMFEGSSGAQDIRPCSSTGALLDGAVDLGDSSARFKDLYLSNELNITANNTALAASVENANAAGYGLRVTTYATGSEYGLAVDSYGGGYSRDFTVGVDGNVNVLTGNLVIGTAGKGIDFSATSGTGTSELLDDYEEGTWTPQLRNNATALTQSWGYLSGTYTKVGRVVHVHFGGRLNSVSGTGTGELRIYGLPFASATTGGFQEPAEQLFLGNQPTAEDSYTVYAFVHSGQAHLGTRELTGGDDVFESNKIDGNTFFKFQMTYYV